jgi:hypothetical protein
MQDCKRITIELSWIMKKKDSLQRHLPEHWKMSLTQRKKKIITTINSACYVSGTVLGAYIHSFNSFCANQWGCYCYCSSFPRRMLRHGQIVWLSCSKSCNKKRRWQGFNASFWIPSVALSPSAILPLISL